MTPQPRFLYGCWVLASPTAERTRQETRLAGLLGSSDAIARLRAGFRVGQARRHLFDGERMPVPASRDGAG